MTHKYDVGDIIANEHFHYLIEDIDRDTYSSYCYMLRCLENNTTMKSYVAVTDTEPTLRKVA